VSIAALVGQTSRPVRVDSFSQASGPIAEEARALGIRSSVVCPIVVGGRLWGVIAASSKRESPFPADTESQMADFTELVATAIANAESRSALAASRARVVAAADETGAASSGISMTASSSVLWLSVGDDGVGGAEPARGSGLIGLRDRVEALGGSIQITSPAGEGTMIAVELPLRPA